MRLHGKRGVLVPASVDPRSGYRRYTVEQLIPAIRLKALREAGVPLAEAARALGGDEAVFGEVLAEHRAMLAVERVRQDAALEELDSVLTHEHRGWYVEERHSPERSWVGVPVPVDDAGDDSVETDRINDAFGGLWTALADSGYPPDDRFWWSLRVPCSPRASAGTGPAELVCRWAVRRAVPRDWSMPHRTVESEILPAGVDLVLRWRHGDVVPELGAGAPHPAFIALLIEAEQRGMDPDLARVRQAPLIEDGVATGFELAMPIDR